MNGNESLPNFSDLGGTDDPCGIGGGFTTSRMQLPGRTWESGNMFIDSHFLPNADMESAVYDDRVWWVNADSKLRLRGDQSNMVLQALFYTDAVRRLQAVEQLTLPPQYSTIPNTGAFSRFEHIWGSVLFVDQMSKREGIDAQTALKLKLRTLVSDIAHTYGSHLGDWMFQGMGGKENQHDLELSQYLGAVGVNAVLEEYNIDPDDVIFPDIEDWIEASQPDLCVDRVDYGLREMNRWNMVIRNSAFGVDDFTLNAQPSLVGHTLESIIKSTSQYYRQYVWPGKNRRINNYMQQFTPGQYKSTLSRGHKDLSFEGFGSYLDEYPRTLPGGFAILTEDAAAASPRTEREIDFPQNPFKIRQIDPLVQSGKGFTRLSELDNDYANRLESHRAHALQTRIARLAIPDPNTFSQINATLDKIEAVWQERLANSRRMTPEELNALVTSSSREVFGTYPFMTFLDY